MDYKKRISIPEILKRVKSILKIIPQKYMDESDFNSQFE